MMMLFAPETICGFLLAVYLIYKFDKIVVKEGVS